MADILFATLVLLIGLVVLAVTMLAGASAPIPGQGPKMRGPLIVGAVLTVSGLMWWAHILG